MKNKNLIKFTSLLGVMTMAGCSLPWNERLYQIDPATANASSSSSIVAEMPENFSGAQKAPE